MYLLDKNVLDEIEKDKPHKNVEAWFNRLDETDIFLSVTSVMEGRKGVEQIRARRPQIAQEIERDLENIVTTFQDRILPIDVAVAQNWGRMIADHGGNCIDAAVAATAKTRRFSVVTRNTKHFSKRKVRIINPYKTPPEIINP